MFDGPHAVETEFVSEQCVVDLFAEDLAVGQFRVSLSALTTLG